MGKLKALYLIDSLAVGGAERSLLDILARFQATQPVMCHVYPNETLKPEYEAAGIRVLSLNVSDKYGFGKAIRRVVQILRNEKPDLIHTTLLRSDIIGRIAGRLAGVPVVSSFVNESYAPVRYSQLPSTMKRKMRLVQLADKMTTPLAFHFVANSETIKQRNVSDLGVPATKVSVIYRGRDPAQFLQDPEDDESWLLDSLSLPRDARVLLNVGRLTLAKNQAELIRAMPEILRQVPNCRLLIAGEGPLRASLEALIVELAMSHQALLLGNRDDVPRLLHLADVFVFPSLYEGHPGALVEAMFAARPIVASDIPVHRETLLDGEAGVLAPLGDPNAFAQCVLDLLRQPARAAALGQRGREIALDRFDITQITAQHEALYADLLQRWRAAH